MTIANDPEEIARMRADRDVQDRAASVLTDMTRYRYSYNFEWMGRPIIQLPQDIVAIQEILWRVKPQLVIETGVAHGGALVFYASILAALGGDRRVVGVDIEIRPHNRTAIESHPMASMIELVEGSSIDARVIETVQRYAEGKSPIIVLLDSNHTHEHVLAELRAYSPFVEAGSYLIVLDTAIADVPDEMFEDRPWSTTANPKTAVHEFLSETNRFEIDRETEDKLLFTVAPDGYLKCVASE